MTQEQIKIFEMLSKQDNKSLIKMLKTKTNVSSTKEVIRDALIMYGWTIENFLAGNEVIARPRKN